MKDVLGITPREPQEYLVEMAYSMIEKGIVKKAKKYKGLKKEGEEEAAAEENKEETKEANGTVSTGEDGKT